MGMKQGDRKDGCKSEEGLQEKGKLNGPKRLKEGEELGRQPRATLKNRRHVGEERKGGN